MSFKSFSASAPGSLMILGEYGVMFGKYALVGAIDQYITVTLTERDDQQIKIYSALGEYSTEIKLLDNIVEPFKFVLTAINMFKAKFKFGFDLHIKSDFSSTIGFASSAAVVVATLSVLLNYFDLTISETKLIQQAKRVIRAVQGRASGSDVAAAVLGGVIAYRAKPFFVEKITENLPISVLYSGSKTTTKVAIKYVMDKFKNKEKLFTKIISAIGECAAQGIILAKQNNLSGLGEIMQIQQGLMVALGVSSARLDELVAELSADKNIFGAKISGAGLGDCVIGLGEIKNKLIPVALSPVGVRCEKV